MSQYRIKIYDASGTLKRSLRASSINTRGYIKNLGIGNYEYEIEALAENPNKSLRILGVCPQRGSFTVVPSPTLTVPVCSDLGKIEKNDNNETIFSWGSVPGADRYTALISELKGNVATPQKIITSTTTTGAITNLRNGNYKFQVRGEKYDIGGTPCAGGMFQVERNIVLSEINPLVVQRSDGLSDNDTIVAGVDDVTFLKFNISNRDSRETVIEGIYLQALGTGASGGTSGYPNFNVALFVNGTQQGSAQNLNENGEADLNDLLARIPAQGQVEFTIVLDTVPTSANSDGVIDSLKINLQAVSAFRGDESVLAKPRAVVANCTDLVCGATFKFISSGQLSASLESTTFSKIITAGEPDVTVLKVGFNASDDEVHIKALYFENSTDLNDPSGISDRADFKLYNSAGQLIQTQQMIEGKLSFQMANNDRIRVPKDDSTFVTVKVSARGITEANQTGKLLKLRLAAGTDIASIFRNPADSGTGIEAVTAATGTDVFPGSIAANSITGEPFVVYRSQIKVKHAVAQPAISGPTVSSQEAYRFTVTADQARQIELGRVSFDFATGGMKKSGGTNFVAEDFIVRQVQNNGVLDATSNIATVSLSENTPTTPIRAVLHVDFLNQRLARGESRTYAVLVANTEDDGGVNIDDDSFSFSILRDITPYVTDRIKQMFEKSLIIWSDESDPNHSSSTISETTHDWLNGYLLEVDTAAKVNND